MRIEHPVRLAVTVVLLALGLLVGLLRPGDVDLSASTMHRVFWLERRADLVLQLGLMLVGALGIRALLPSADEDEQAAEDEYGH